MNLQAQKGTLENGDKFIKIDTTQFNGTVTLKLFGEDVTLTTRPEAKHARITEWFLNGKKIVSVSYSNR